ncbi:MAG: amino acid adenylation domain-containing protein [Candidatus Aminicenantes bacterium]|nr:amino acid adenylation domain-containing protein [Candidatus Aminicenantes bacterium]
MDFRGVKVLNRYFEEQAETTPDRIAVFSAEKSSGVTYRELNERANRLAHLLRDMGVKPDSIVALMVDPSIECILGIMTILKAGGAYLPISATYPVARKQWMLEDSCAPLLVSRGHLLAKDENKVLLNNIPSLRVLDLDSGKLDSYNGDCIYFVDSTNVNRDLAYVIYTSGSTGGPKGVLLEHRNVVNLILGLNERVYRKYGDGLRVALVAPYIFDGSVKQVFGALLQGHTLCIVPEDSRVDGVRLAEFYNKYSIEISDGAPAHIRLLTGVTPVPGVKHFLIGGEALPVPVVEHFYSGFGESAAPLITNVYGPTECCVDTTGFEVSRENIQELRGFAAVPIGAPLLNQEVIITGEPGELCIAGASISRGYLNNPELTAEKFSYFHHSSFIIHHSSLYCTGDLARWLPGGNIEFLGRIDYQVKVRGFRIELGEIESRLAAHPAVKEAVVTAREDKYGEKYLCAYIVTAEEPVSISAELKEYLSLTLPEYMVPLFFVTLDKMPLTASGKADRRSLPAPVPAARPSYAAPAGVMEKTLLEIWSGVLGIPAGVIGVDDDFLEWGGHSLKATILAGRIEKSVHIKCPISYIFQYPTIRELARHIRESAGTWEEQIPPVEEKEYYPLSSAQKRLFFLDRWENIGASYHMTYAFSVQGKLDIERLRKVSLLLIARHESFRTSFHLLGDEPVQRVHDHVEFKIDVLGDRPFDISCAPLLRVGTIAVSAEETLLVFDMHHIIGDGSSMGVFFQEFSRLYNSGDPEIEVGRLSLPGIRYRDFAQWQNRLLESGKIKEQEAYWLGLYPDAADIPRLELPGDFPRPGRLSFEGDHYRFSLTPEETQRFRQMIHRGGVTPYMGLLAVFILLLYKYTGQKDMVVGTGIMGRRHAALENMIGMFVNTLAIRHFPMGEMAYDEFLGQVKDCSLKAFENQDVQFEALVERLNLARDPARNPLCDVLFVLQNFQPGELTLENVQLTPYPLERKNSKFDITLFAREKEESIHFTLEYRTALFKKETMERLAGHFVHALRQVCETPAITLDALELLSAEEKRQLLEDFNRTAAVYPAEKTIRQLFAEQVEKAPDRIVLVGADEGEEKKRRREEEKNGGVETLRATSLQQITYRELHDRANRLANYLYSEVVTTAGECVAILLDRSLDRVAAMLGVLTVGGAYIPLESSLPEERIKTVINDASVGMVISQKKYIRLLNRLQWDCNSFRTFLCLDSEDILAEEEIEQSQLMDTKLWEYVGETARDEITGGGWISSYTGEPIPAAEMAEYGDNVLRKLEPLLHKKMRVLEIGCATGITMFRIAPRVGFYYGTDLSPVIIEKNKQRVIAEGHQNIRLACMAAHEIDGLEEENFDLVIINSVIQCFHGHNYLRRVLRKVAAKTGSPGYLFIGDIMDQGLKESLVRELKEFKRKSGERTKTDWSAELFVARDFFEDLQGDIPEIGKIEFSRKLYTIENELTKFRYDALLTIGKRRRGVQARHKYQDDIRALERYGKETPTVSSGSGGPAYVIYTSGTTGKPRGVMVEHRSLVNLCWWHHRYYEVTEWDRAVQFAGFSFDASVWEVFPYLVKGAVLIVIPNEMGPDVGELNEFFEKHGVTIAFLPTPLCEQFMAMDSRSLRVLLTGGDKLRHYIKRNYQLYNNYGPTENAVVATAYKVDDFSANIPIGAPIANNHIYILNKKNLQLQPVGVPGELCICGDSLARGYLNHPELTGEKFKIINYKLQIINGSGALRAENFHHSSFIIHHSILYCTGDLARWLLDGNIEFLGRMDQQVKIRGFRIELEEIRGRLEKHEEVKEAAVVVREDADGEKKICAYIVSRHAGVAIVANLGDFLAVTLPDYMIPAHFVLLEKIPLTVSGKIDRKALPAPKSWGRVPDGGNIPPRDVLEKTLAGIWAEVLNPGGDKSVVGIDIDFFKAGGHSLKVAALVSRIHRDLNVRLPLSQVFARPTIRGLAEYIRGAVGEQWSGIAPAPVGNDYPLSPAQRRIYIMDRLGSMYNMPRVMTVRGNLDLRKLESALIKMIRRHESLRTSFHMMEDQPVQEIHDRVEFEIEYSSTDYTDYTDDKDDKIHHSSFIIHHFIRAFDLSKAPLLRVAVMKEAEEQYVLMMDTHHIVSDGISQGIFMKELWALYAGQVLPPLRVQYKDYAWWQHQQRENKENAWRDMETFWVHRFQGEIPPLELPYDFPRPPAQDYRGKTIAFELSAAETRALKSICWQVNNNTGGVATLYMAALALVNVLLAKLSGVEDIVVGTPTAGRSRPDLQAIIGMFVGTLAMRNFPAAEKNFDAFLEEVKESALAAFEHQDYPFEELVEKVVITRDAGRSPLFDVMLAVQNIDRPAIGIPGLMVKPRSFDYSPAHFDLFWQCFESGDILKWTLNYSVSFFEETTIRRFIVYFKEIVNSVSQAPRQRIADIDMLPEEEKIQVLYDFNRTAVEYPAEKTIHQLFVEQVERTPDGIAVIGSTVSTVETLRATSLQQITYRQLNEQSNRLAGLLVEKGVLADSIVGLMIERSIEMIIGILGILKAGGAYLPIDPELPQERTDYMLKDSGAKILLTANQLSFHHSSFIVHHSSHFAYVIYTSGSTGVPKGVIIENRAVVNFITCITAVIPFTSADSILSLTTISFDIFVLEALLPLTAGSRVVIGTPGQQTDPAALAAVMGRELITHLQLTPSRLQLFMEHGEAVRCLGRLRYLLVGGELFPDHLLQRVRAFIKGRLYNLYGPTETTVWSLLRCVEKGDGGINIGGPMANTQIYILSSQGRVQPIGVLGELCIGGAGVAPGYLNNPELTGEKFKIINYKLKIINGSGALRAENFHHSSFIIHHLKLYRTGDLARWLADGSIEFLGRVDQQVKIRGFRIELGEIETRLAMHPLVKEAAVAARADKSGEKSLCAYITPRETGAFDVPRLKEYLAQYLPQYMVPQYYVEIGRLPLTPGGKVDRRGLPEPRVENAGVYTAPRGPVEEALVEIWRGLLFGKVAQAPLIGIDDNFFQLGGHSLKAMILTGRIEKNFHIKCSLTYIFNHATIRELARFIREVAGTWDEQIPPVEEKEYYPLSSAQKRLFFLDRWENIGVSYNMTVAFSVKGKLDIERLRKVSLLLIERHESLRTSFHLLGDEPVQRIHNDLEFNINLATDEHGQTRTPFDLSCAPLFRVGVTCVSAEEALLVFDMHHIIGDGSSMGIFFEEFSRLYNSGDPEIDVGQLSLQATRHRDFAQWQNRLLEGGKIKEQEDYWLNLYPDAADIPRLELPVDFPRPGRFSFEGDHYRFSLTPEETRRFRQMIHRRGVTPYMGLLAAFIVLLYKYTGQNDMVVGTGIMGRRHAALENMIGMFVNTLAIRHFPLGEMAYDEFLGQVKDSSLKAFENQDVQFEALVERLNLARDPARNPLCDVLFVLQNFQPGELTLENVQLTPYPLERKNSKFDVTLFAREKGESIHFTLEYRTALFKRETMERLAGHFVHALRQVCDTPGITLDALELLSAEEKRQLLEDFNRTAAGYPAEKTIQQLFAEQVEKAPDRIALVGADEGEEKKRRREEEKNGGVETLRATSLQQITYRRLNDRANRLANYLYSEVVTAPGECVAILLDRSIDRVAAMLGVLKSGSAYIPLESSLPEERIKTIIDDASVGMVISQKKYIRLLNRLQWECASFRTFLCLDSEDIQAEEEIEKSELMDTKLWEYVGETAKDAITGGGWISSYTGEPIPAAEMAEYGDNVLRKLEPLLHEKMRVLEIGCATGITMFRIAPRVGFYYGTDLSPVIIEKNKQRVIAERHQNIRLACMAAHEIDGLEEENFDLVIINSVIQCFHGHNYLRRVLRKAAAKTGGSGYLFIGDIMDQGLKESLIRELKVFKRKNGERTKTDWSAELFVARDFFEDLQGDIPEIGKIEFSRKIYTIENELTKFRYDALLTVGKRRRGAHARHKYQEDIRALERYGKETPMVPSGPGSPAYVIYTSGTTGKPRGVMVEHRSLVNLCWWHHGYYDVTERDRAVQFASFSFDASVWEVFPYLVKGAVSIIIPNEMGPDVGELNDYFEKHGVTVAFLPTPLCEQFMAIDNRSLRLLLTGGDKLRHYIKRNYRLYNNYGPTENAVVATAYKVDDFSANIPIGAPISNNQIYILNKKNLQLQPVGVPGELCIAGDSLARGYLNQPELTGEKFKIINYKLKIINGSGALRAKNFHHSSFIIHHSILYCTGDLARWLSDGNIEFLGRIDQQVKIRGFRIELGEIETLLLQHKDIEEAVVLVLPDRTGDFQLCAYLKNRREVSVQELSDHLARHLPAYMVPGLFVFLERFPLTPSGKVDRKALRGPEPEAGTGEYSAPRDETEEKLQGIWSEILGNDKEHIGIDGNFFQLGGHSLKVINMTMGIHREFSVKIGMTEVFKNPTIRGLAEIIRGAAGNRLVTIHPAEEREYYTLSSAQERFYIIYRLDPGNTVYNVNTRVILEGRLDRERLENSFRELIRRHESLRTSFQIINGNPVQRVHKQVEFEIEYNDLATDEHGQTRTFLATEANEDIIHHFSRPFDLANAPLLRVALIKMEEYQHLLMVGMPHIISDGVTHRLLVEEFMALYRGESLPLLRLQYKDFSQWQNSPAMQEEMRQQEAFWLGRFEGDIPVLQIPVDYPRTEVRSPEGSTMTFELAVAAAQKLREMAAEEGATLYMVMLAVFNVLLYKLGGQEDIVVGTAVAGRIHPDLERIIGVFLNTLALRNFPRGQMSFKRFLTEVKERTLAAFDHQDYQFEELVQKVMKTREKGRHPLFDAMFGFTPFTAAPVAQKAPAGEIPDGLRFKPYKRKGVRSRFDITFTGADNGETFVFLFEYSTALFKPRTMERFAGYFKEIATSAAASPHVLLKDIAITTDLTPAVSDAFRDDENDFKF